MEGVPAAEPAEIPGGDEAAPGDTGGAEGVLAGGMVVAGLPAGELGAADVPRESTEPAAKPGEEIGCAGVVRTVFAAGAPVPAGCQPADEGGGGVEYAGSAGRPAASPVPGGGILVCPNRNGSELGA